jgi:hypothetical protein
MRRSWNGIRKARESDGNISINVNEWETLHRGRMMGMTVIKQCLHVMRKDGKGPLKRQAVASV